MKLLQIASAAIKKIQLQYLNPTLNTCWEGTILSANDEYLGVAPELTKQRLYSFNPLTLATAQFI